ncbi:MAG TPA: SEC-C metal-binding domain-containing protein, partial [Longimicrobiales bacterium]
HEFNSLEDVEQLVVRSVRDGFKRKLEGFGELQERILSWVLLTVIDDKWRDHLYDLDHLKASIGFRGWGQKDPLIEYKQEAYTMFVDLMTDLRKSVASLTFRAQVQVPQPRPALPERIMLSGPTDTPDTRAARAVPAPEEYEQDELDDGVAHAMGGARHLPTPTVAGAPMRNKPVDVRQLATNRGEEGEAPAHKPVVKEEPKVGRNDPCPCGSGKKYKKCHGAGLP